MKYDIPLPVLLDSSGNEVRRIRATNVSLIETLTPLSTATLTVPAEDTLPLRSFVKLYNANGLSGVYRTRQPEETYQAEECTIQLEHALSEIGDYIIDSTLSVDDAANVVAATIMSYYGGSLWALGTCAATTNIKASLDNSNVLTALSDLMNALPEYMMTFDFSSVPWHFSIVAKPTTVTAEGRLSRNIESATITRDDTELCTRVYMKKLANGHLDADTISTYGVIERFISGDDSMTAAEAATIAQKYLDQHKNPTMTVTISGYDFYQVTGVTLDRVRIGEMYRLAIPDANATYTQLITQLEWGDVYGRAGEVTITLADEAETMSSVMAGLQLQMAKVVNNTYLLSNAISGDRQQLNIMSEQINVHAGKLDVLAHDINLVASEEERAILEGHSMTLYHEANVAIAANGVQIGALQTATNNITGRVETCESTLSVQAGQIAAKVSNGEVATELSVELGNVSISGGNLVVSGYATVQALNAVSADIGLLVTGQSVAQAIAATSLTSSRLDVGGSFVYAGDNVSWQSINWQVGNLATKQFLGKETMSLGHYHEMSESGGRVTLGPPTTNAGAASFDIAATAFYQNAVAAAYDRGVQAGAGSISVDALTIVKSGSPSWSNGTFTQDVTAYALHNNGSADADILKSRTVKLDIDASEPYGAGVSSVAVSSITNTSAAVSPSGKVCTAIMKATASNGATRSQTFNLDVTDAYDTGVDSVTLSQSRATTTATIYNDSSGTVSVRLYIKLSNGKSYTPYVDVSYRTID